MLLALAAGLRPGRSRLGSTPHRRTLLRVIPTYAPPQSPSPCYSVPAGARLTRPELGQPNRPSHNGQRHYPHSARGTTERTCPAVSSPEASRTPATRVCGTARAAGVREPLTIAEVSALSSTGSGALTSSQAAWLIRNRLSMSIFGIVHAGDYHHGSDGSSLE